MLDTLSYSVTFPNGRSFERTLSFREGMTAIIGPNEAGKSLTLELIRFCLFGSAALRGTADDYQHLQAALTFTVRGDRYGITRTLKNASFGLDGEEVRARGTKPVNAAVIGLLGFDLDVFDVACAASQGDVERLANMKPTARREMVDRLIGADRIQGIVDWTGEEALGLKREIDALTRTLVEPTKPVKPEGYEPSAKLAEQIEGLRVVERAAIEAQAFLANEPVDVVAPELPHEIPVASLDRADELLARPVYDYDVEAVYAQHLAAEAWIEKSQFLQTHPLPTTGVTSTYASREIERRTLEAELARLQQSQKLCCPSCNHRFTLADGEIAALQLQIDDLLDQNQLVRITITEGWDVELRRARDWESEATRTAYERVAAAVPTERPAIKLGDVLAARENGIHRDELARELAALGLEGATKTAITVLRRQLLAFEAATEAYGPARARRLAWESKAAEVRTKLLADQGQLTALPRLVAAERAALAYERDLKGYEAARDAYERLCKEIATKQEERQSWLKGKEQLNELRLKLKSYLAPSLSAAASLLLARMTRGARRSIWVDEAFEITVDGQRLNTLSGSGKVCANLALRLGLAQVLTNNVLSVFVGDEMDAFMDGERVAALNESLEQLLPRIGQIVVVTHKPPICKQVIDLGAR